MGRYDERSRRRRRDDDWDDEDDDDDYDRPRKKTRPPKYKSHSGLMISLFSVTALILLLGGLGIGLYFVLRQAPGNAVRPGGGGGVAPKLGGVGGVGGPVTGSRTVWVNYRQAEGLYSVKIPTTTLIPGSDISKLRPFGNDQSSDMLSASQEVSCHARVLVMSPDSLAREQKALQEVGPNKRQVNWLGRVAIEESDPNDPFAGVRRRFIDGNRLFEFKLSGFPRKPTDEERAIFFDSVVIGPR